MTATKRAEGEWAWRRGITPREILVMKLRESDGQPIIIAQVFSEADAARIVRAVNTHEPMAELLRRIDGIWTRDIESPENAPAILSGETRHIWLDIRAILATLTGPDNV